MTIAGDLTTSLVPKLAPGVDAASVVDGWLQYLTTADVLNYLTHEEADVSAFCYAIERLRVKGL